MSRVTSLSAGVVLLLAFALRVIGLASVPPGWRDDEVIETTVHAQIVLDGGRPLYFIQAEGHEPLYHYLSAGWIALVGRSLLSVRMVSAFFGLLTVAAAYRLGRKLFGAQTALFASLLLAVSFWALMYSRVKIRHTAELPFALLSFAFWFDSLRAASVRLRRAQSSRRRRLAAAASALFLALSLYTYLAALALPIIFLLAAAYFFLRHRWSAAWRITAVVLVIGLLLYLPLARAIAASAERLSVVGRPLMALRSGDAQPLINNVIGTAAMFGGAGDPEALYNLPRRPALGLIGFYFFVAGTLISLSRWREPRHAFMLIWLIGGLAPGIVSTPPASFGHTITALPAVLILCALPVFEAPRYFSSDKPHYAFRARLALGALLFVGVAARDLPDYFFRWPQNELVRYLYKAQLHESAQKLRGAPPATYVLNGPLSIWDRRAFELEGVRFASPPRWVNAEWAVVFPAQAATYLFPLRDWQTDMPPTYSFEVRFADGLIFEGWDQRGAEVRAHWRVASGYRADEPPMGASVASPPFPAFAFIHLLAADGSFVAGSDRFDVDAFSLQPGDRYVQRHWFAAPPGTYTLTVGLYKPDTGERLPADDGRDEIPLGSITLP